MRLIKKMFSAHRKGSVAQVSVTVPEEKPTPASSTVVDVMTSAREESCRQLSFGVAYIRGGQIEGHIAEFGTENGQTAIAITKAMLTLPRKLPGVDLYLFDSFQGLPLMTSAVDLECPHHQTGRWLPGICMAKVDKVQLASMIKRAGLSSKRLHIHDGWFKETLPRLPSEIRFAMVHIDCDLYESACDVLNDLFSRNRLTEGAVVFFDDWNCNRGSPKYGERRAWAEATEKYHVVYSDCGGYAWNGHKFIVHSYGQRAS